jgi:hypothetical protein
MPFLAKRPMLQGALTPALALLLSLAPLGAQALGLGRPVVNSSLGAPLDLSLPLHLADGETLTDACLRAEISAGDARVPAGLLQLRIEGEPGQQRVRVQSAVRIEEPALRITLALGCPVRLTREFNAFIDPPATTAAALPPAALPVPAPAPLAAAPLSNSGTVTPEPVPRAVAEAPVPPQAPRPKHKPRPHARPPVASSAPRLELDRPEILANAAPPHPAASAPSAPESGSTPELEAQIKQLEQTVARLQAELQARQAAAASAATAAPVVALPVQPPPHVSAYRDPMTWLVTIALSLIGGAAAFFGSRWLDQRAQREHAYLRALHAAAEGASTSSPPTTAPPPAQAVGMAPQVATKAASPLPSMDAGQHMETRPQPKPLIRPPAQAAMDPMMATQPLPAQAAAAPTLSLAQELGVADDLLDLQQQADFLQLLGQQDAVTDLLAGQLTHTSAMPSLMLMELYQQRGDAAAFEDVAKKFAQRYLVQPPAWGQSVGQGRSLDACPSVIAHLQVIWSDAAAATHMLQVLLARGAGPGVTHFELPALRDLLMLYGVARDLFEAGLRSGDVDVMLPI